MPRDVMPLWQDAALARAMKAQNPHGLSTGQMGQQQPYHDPYAFRDEVLDILEAQNFQDYPRPIELAGLYPSGDQMVNIDLLPDAPSGGFSQGDTIGIGSALDPATIVHEVGGHSGFGGLRESGELGFDLSEYDDQGKPIPLRVAGGGALERRLAAALPGTFSNQQFLTDAEAKAALGLLPGQKFPDTGYYDDQGKPIPFERSAGFAEQMPTAADWYDVQQTQNLRIVRDENGKIVRDKDGNIQWRNLGKPMRAGESFVHMIMQDFINRESPTEKEIEKKFSELSSWMEEGDYYMGQNPFTQEHGGIDTLVGMRTDPSDSPQAAGAADRLRLYGGGVQDIEAMMHAFRDPDSKFYRGKDAAPIIWGGESFGPRWDYDNNSKTELDEDIYNYAVDQHIRMAPERALFGSNLSEGIIGAIDAAVNSSDPDLDRLRYYNRDIGDPKD